jgi:hypothetical protein
MPSTRPRRRARLRLESLEVRAVPAVFRPDPAALDGAPGSLRAAVVAAGENRQNDTIILGPGVYRLSIPNTAGIPKSEPVTGDLDLGSRRGTRSPSLGPGPECRSSTAGRWTASSRCSTG